MSNGAKLKICVYAISKNEEKFVKRFCESAKDADLIVIADTGSTDNTVALARDCGAVVYQICISPWRFDKARDAALALVPADVDVCISIDLDEVLEPGWREEIERLWTPSTTRLGYRYDWGCEREFITDKIHGRHGYFWHHPCHEFLKLDPRGQQVRVESNKLLVRHLPDPEKSRGSYLDLLEMSVKEDPSCPRNSFYFARELHFRGMLDESIAECKRFLELPGAAWYHERSYALRIIGKCREAQGANDAEKWYLLAAAEAPSIREPWCALMLLYYQQSRWAECFAAAQTALRITDKQLVYTNDPESWGSLPWDVGSVAAWNLGLKDQALDWAHYAVTLCPNDPRLHNNVKMIEDAVRTTQSSKLSMVSPDDVDSFIVPS